LRLERLKIEASGRDEEEGSYEEAANSQLTSYGVCRQARHLGKGA